MDPTCVRSAICLPAVVGGLTASVFYALPAYSLFQTGQRVWNRLWATNQSVDNKIHELYGMKINTSGLLEEDFTGNYADTAMYLTKIRLAEASVGNMRHSLSRLAINTVAVGLRIFGYEGLSWGTLGIGNAIAYCHGKYVAEKADAYAIYLLEQKEIIAGIKYELAKYIKMPESLHADRDQNIQRLVKALFVKGLSITTTIPELLKNIPEEWRKAARTINLELTPLEEKAIQRYWKFTTSRETCKDV